MEITKGFPRRGPLYSFSTKCMMLQLAPTRCFCDSQGQLNNTIDLLLLDDATPEDKDEYIVSLSNIKTFGEAGLMSQSLFKNQPAMQCCNTAGRSIRSCAGVTTSGHATLDLQNRQSVLTVDTSDEPYGLLTIAASSLMVTTEERDQTINIYVTREFGASGPYAVDKLQNAQIRKVKCAFSV